MNKVIDEIDKTYILSNEDSTIEKTYYPWNGFATLLIFFCVLIASVICIICASLFEQPGFLGLGIPVLVLDFISLSGFFTIQPNEANVLVQFGTYKGTVKKSGFHWCSPLFTKRLISLRSNNLNGSTVKVNDKSGNPIIIAAVVIWRVKSTTKALFDVLDYVHFVEVQYESAIRGLAMRFAYEKTTENEVCLRENHQLVNDYLIGALHRRFEKAGIQVEEAKISALSYSFEIAAVMLRKQQAEAIILARETIVNGAINIIAKALASLEEKEILVMTAGEKTSLISNLLVVLCSESPPEPVLNI